MIKIKKSQNADSRTAIGHVTKEELLKSSKQHINDVREAMIFFREMINDAGYKHDYTKIDEAGINDFYDSFSRGLKKEYSPDGEIPYNDEFKAEKWFQRHITEERHHVKDNCPDDVNLIDLLERVADIVTAGLARSGLIYDVALDAEILAKAYRNTIELLKSVIEVEE